MECYPRRNQSVCSRPTPISTSCRAYVNQKTGNLSELRGLGRLAHSAEEIGRTTDPVSANYAGENKLATRRTSMIPGRAKAPLRVFVSFMLKICIL